MRHPNPRYKQEFEFVAWLMENARNGIPTNGTLDKIKELYGEPIVKQISSDLSNKIIDALQEARIFHSRKHRESEKHGYGIGYYFGNLRRIILTEFYPGKEGYYRVQQYWKEQRRQSQQNI